MNARILPALFASALCALLAACAVPLGPGYTVEKQEVEVHWPEANPGRVRAAYRLKNTGNQPLDFVELTLPAGPAPPGLRVWLDGAEVTATLQSAENEQRLRIPLRPAWDRKQKRSLVVGFNLPSPAGPSGPAFFLLPEDWYPRLESPAGLFGRGGTPPEKWELRVTVPRDFRVHASGESKGQRRRDGLTEHRFRQRPGRDYQPFLIAGRFQQMHIEEQDIHVRLWLLEGADDPDARRASEHIARTVAAYRKAFGRRLTPSDNVWVLNVPASQGAAQREEELRSLPDTVLFESSRLTERAEAEVLCELNAQLAEMWFFHLAQPAPDARALAGALRDYAATLIPGDCAAPSGEQAARTLLVAYDAAAQRAREQPSPQLARDLEEREAALFLRALEERYGRTTLNAALQRMLQSLRGTAWTVNDLRVALEVESGADPADLFRLWLNHPGIPQEFRARYQPPQAQP